MSSRWWAWPAKTYNELVGTYNVAESSLITLSLGIRKVNITVAAAKAGENYLLFPVNNLPAGYGLDSSAPCVTDGTIQASVLVPVLNGSYSIPVRVVRVVT